jgi:hypothetical protein
MFSFLCQLDKNKNVENFSKPSQLFEIGISPFKRDENNYEVFDIQREFLECVAIFSITLH